MNLLADVILGSTGLSPRSQDNAYFNIDKQLWVDIHIKKFKKHERNSGCLDQ